MKGFGMHRVFRIWSNRVLGVGIVVLAGLLGGWIFRPRAEPPSAERADGTPDDRVASAADRRDEPTVISQKENRLAKETSPYLLLHKHNPIDWYPWGTEALQRAKAEDKLIFLSIGYSSCFWCHVMERESFNDPEIARLLNESFVSIKVDREELPDIDEIFMTFVQVSNRGRGGWPLTVFLTPDAKPIVGSTYFPPRETRGMPGLFETLGLVLDRWAKNRVELEDQAEAMTQALQSINSQRGIALRQLDRKIISETIDELSGEFDAQFGGFGYDPRNAERPKFPQASVLGLLAYQIGQSSDGPAAAMLIRTLQRMTQGGIWDCVGGGFHRYTVDRFWRVPHFEKMLYDNAQLARVYLEAFERTSDPAFRQTAVRIFQFIEREMTSEEGGFFCALDAESEHEEGKYYVWSKQEVQALLHPHEFDAVSNVQMRGPPHLPGNRYVLQLGDALASIAEKAGIPESELAGLLDRSAAKLLQARRQRTPPLLDTKILTDKNGLMIAALADAYRILGDVTYRTAAERAAHLILSKARAEDGRLLHVYAAGSAKVPAYLEDHAFLLDGLVALYRATKDEQWLEAANWVADQMNELFWDDVAGGYFYTAKDQPFFLTRLKSTEDGAEPSGNSAAALGLVRLARSSGQTMYAKRSAETLAAFAGPMARSPGRWAHMARALGEYLDAGFPNDALAVRAPNSEPHVIFAQAVMPQRKIRPGAPFQFTVAFEIDRSWHIYANPASSPQYVPTTLEVTSELLIQNVYIVYPKPWTYRPEGTDESVAVYNDRGRIVVSAKLDSGAPAGPAEIQLALRYQACNDQRCLAPKTIRITLPVEIVAGP